jgi:hypothetical protein
MNAESMSAPSAFELIKKIQARPVVACADTGDFVAVRVDTFPQCGQYEWKSSVPSLASVILKPLAARLMRPHGVKA